MRALEKFAPAQNEITIIIILGLVTLLVVVVLYARLPSWCRAGSGLPVIGRKKPCCDW